MHHVHHPTEREEPSMTLPVRRIPLIVGFVALTALVAACGETRQTSPTGTSGGDASTTGTRTVEIVMEDIKFDQTTLTVTAGQAINFRFTNTGKIAHDAFIGDEAAQTDHEAEMAEMSDTGGHDMEAEAITLQPGESGELSFTFDKSGVYQIGCHQPGHYAAGMKIEVTVE